MNEKEFLKTKEECKEIAEILAYLKQKGFVFEGEDKGYLKCLLDYHKETAQINAS